MIIAVRTAGLIARRRVNFRVMPMKMTLVVNVAWIMFAILTAIHLFSQ